MGRLRVLQAGKVDRNPADLLTRVRATGLVEALRSRADYVVFDTPPMLTAGDAFPLMSVADTVLVVARQGRTKRGAAEAVHATLDRLGIQRASVVLTDAIPVGADGYAVSPEFATPSI
jgi:Mrp family chromosome partitioning ATPase